MSLCDFCAKEAKFYFICPKCGKRFCNEHRKPEDHHCTNAQIPHENVVEEKTSSPIVITANHVHQPEYEVDEYVRLDEVIFTEKIFPTPRKLKSIKIPLAVLILGTLLSVAFIGILSDSNEAPGSLKQISDALFDFFSGSQTDNYDNETMDENATIEYNSIQNDSARSITTIALQSPAK